VSLPGEAALHAAEVEQCGVRVVEEGGVEMNRRAWGAAIVFAALVAAGCGGGGNDRVSKDDYEQELQGVGTSVQESFQGLGSSMKGDNPSSLDEAADRVGEIQDSLRKKADDLEDVEPPENAEKENDQLVDGLNGFADELEDFKKALDDGDVQAIQQFAQDFQDSEAAKDIQEAGQSLEKKGYDLGN